MSYTKFSFIALAFASAIFVFSCKKESPTANTNSSTTEALTMAEVRGTVKTPNQQNAVPNAVVKMTLNGVDYTTRTAVDGSFALEVPAGAHTLNIYTGNGDLFHTEVGLNLATGEQKTLDPDETTLTQVGQLAFVHGQWDAIENVITSLGYSITELQSIDFLNFANLSLFDAIFINCAAEDLTTDAQYANLGQFVTEGGSLYISDYAVSYLLGTGTDCARAMGFIDDATLCTSRVGPGTMASNAVFAPSDLQEYMQMDSIGIDYDTFEWEQVMSVDTSFWEVLISHNTYGPLLLRTNQFSNDTNGLQGNIYFTTFHNEAATESTPEVASIMQFLILNL